MYRMSVVVYLSVADWAALYVKVKFIKAYVCFSSKHV